MKDGRTRLVREAEHALDLNTGAVVSAMVQGTDTGDAASMVENETGGMRRVDSTHSVLISSKTALSPCHELC